MNAGRRPLRLMVINAKAAGLVYGCGVFSPEIPPP
jgi:hypothetical protein